jgi:class 3 adenylate cyclase/tetratricopeptide (TPR) repeat protein
MTEREQLEAALAALETQRALVGAAVVAAGAQAIRQRIALLTAAPAGDERKIVTVLFADVSGFTTLAESLDAEDVGDLIATLWGRLDAAILAHGGLIDKHLGDGVMALFGTPLAQEDDPERAVRAALEMQAGLQALDAARPAGRPPLRMRIGIHTGPVLLCTIGMTGERTAIGHTVNLASRLEQAAPVGSILLSHDTYRQVRGLFEMPAQPPLTVKGAAEPVQTYLVERAQPRGFVGLSRGIEGLHTRMVGREAELARLQDAVTQAQAAGHSRMITVVGEAGVGKSRLLDEFTAWLDRQPGLVRYFKGRARQETAGLPYALLRDLFAARFGIADSDPATVARAKLVSGILGFLGPDATEKAHFLGHHLGLDFSASPYLSGILQDSRQIHDRALHYAVQFFSALAREGLVVLLVEDAQWADDGSLDLIAHLARHVEGGPLVIVAVARPALLDRRPAWGQDLAGAARLDLQPLSAETTGHLIAELLQKLPAVPAALAALLAQRAEGNPYYLEELVKMLIDEGVIQTGATWQVAPERLAQAHVPPTLAGVLQARLDSLAPGERATLQCAAIVGRIFWDAAVAQVQREAGVGPAASDPDPQTRLASLWDKDLIFRQVTSTFQTAREYLFKHALLRDVTYESVLKRHRPAYHAAVARWLVQSSGDRADEVSGLIAAHYAQAGRGADAAAWYARAGRQAETTYAPEAAIGYYRQALTLLPAPADDAVHLSLQESLARVLRQQARYSEALATLDTVRLLAAQIGDRRAEAGAWVGRAFIQSRQGEHQAALDDARRAAALAEIVGADDELVEARRLQGMSLFHLNDPAALPTLQAGLDRSTELADLKPREMLFNSLGIVHGMMGHYEQALHYLEQALAIARARGDRAGIAVRLNNLGETARLWGDYPAALAYYREARAIAQAIGDRSNEIVFVCSLGQAQVGLGQYAAGEAALREAIGLAEAAGASTILSESYPALAEALLAQGRVPEAQAAAEQAMIWSRKRAKILPRIWRTLGRVAAAQQAAIQWDGGTYTAAACFAESLRLATSAGVDSERARTLRAWGSYEQAAGDSERGATLWQEGRALFTALDLPREVARMDAAPAAQLYD